MNIYAITKGYYSDYHICALTLDEEKAKRLQQIYTNRYNEASIEVFKDGEGADLSIYYYCDENGCNPEIEDYPGDEEVVVNKFTKKIYGVRLYAKDAAHAEKKAHDMIAEYKAKQANIC